nr:MAG TPA: Avd-like-generating retroelement protein [Caudoviricetes sp.]
MTVPVSRRGENKLAAAMAAHELAVYTIKICCNTKVFASEYQVALTRDIVNTAKNIAKLTMRANNVLVKSTQLAQARLRYQYEAANYCNDLLVLIQLAKPVFHLAGKRVRYWGGLVIRARELIRAWHDANAKDYKAKGFLV